MSISFCFRIIKVCAEQEDGAVEVVHLFVKKWGWGKSN